MKIQIRSLTAALLAASLVLSAQAKSESANENTVMTKDKKPAVAKTACKEETSAKNGYSSVGPMIGSNHLRSVGVRPAR